MHLGHEGNKMSTNKTTNNVKSIFDQSIDAKQSARDELSSDITSAIETMVTALKKVIKY